MQVVPSHPPFSKAISRSSLVSSTNLSPLQWCQSSRLLRAPPHAVTPQWPLIPWVTQWWIIHSCLSDIVRCLSSWRPRKISQTSNQWLFLKMARQEKGSCSQQSSQERSKRSMTRLTKITKRICATLLRLRLQMLRSRWSVKSLNTSKASEARYLR